MFPILALALLPVAAPPAVTLGGATNCIAYPATQAGRYQRVDATFRLCFTGPSEGAGLAFLSTSAYGSAGSAPSVARWEEPNLDHSLGIGFDTSDPPTQDIFNADGNLYNRPQHEVSLHWDGVEVANVVSPVAFEDGKPHDVAVRLRFVAGGAMVTVLIDGTPAYADAFVIGPDAYRSRLAFGFNPGGGKGRCDFALTRLTYADRTQPSPSPTHAVVFDGAILTGAHQQDVATVDLPAADKSAERVILTLTLSAPPGGIDPWDRSGSIYVWGDDGERHEVLRFMTPFGRPYRWRADVTDYQSLLRGRRKFAAYIDTWAKGWSVDVALDYFWGRPALQAFRVTTLWSGNWEYGNPADPMDAKFVPRRPILDRATKAAKIRLIVTGHGMSPNTGNAAEFMPALRTLMVNGHAFENLLWKTDNYLNPCRPQGGTWKFDRAGWGPGSLVVPWDVDVTSLVKPAQPALIEYKPQPYLNQNAGKSRAYHIVEVQLIEYR